MSPRRYASPLAALSPHAHTCPLHHPAGTRGPSAAALLHPRWAAAGLDADQLRALDSEGRVLLTDHGAFVLVNVYGPAISSEERAEERMAFKMQFYRVRPRDCTRAAYVQLNGKLSRIASTIRDTAWWWMRRGCCGASTGWDQRRAEARTYSAKLCGPATWKTHYHEGSQLVQPHPCR